MKKRSLAIILALVLVMAFGTSAFAAQAISQAGFGGMTTYQATPTTTYVYNAVPVYVYNNATGVKDVAKYVYTEGTKFNPDGKTNYPYEIYLPNEGTPAQYRIHTSYTKNTDACASCHATHTAVGASLLQWYSTYETCMACHDGTVTTTYNVEEGKIGQSAHYAFGGAFGNGSEAYASQHNVQGSVSISAAPGGSVVGKDVNPGNKTITMWQTSFGCESCHSPHGQGGNARILNPDPNGFATLNNTKTYTVQAVTGIVYDGTKLVTLIKGYPYTATFLVNGIADKTTPYKINNSTGYSVITGGAFANLTVKATASVQVTMNIQHYLEGTETVLHMSGINTFCGTCHTDYNTETQSVVNKNAGNTTEIMGTEANRPGYGALTGEYSKAHRHSVGLDFNYGGAADQTLIGNDKLMVTMQGKISCLTCHFAHGTNQDFWGTAIGTQSASYFVLADKRVEIAGSSALKRIPNMGTCEACHQKADANEGYAANSIATGITNGFDVNAYMSNAAHESYFTGNTYKDATTCLICHASAGDDFMKSVHWKTDGPSSANKDFFGGEMKVKDVAVFNDGFGFSSGMPFGMSDRFCGFPGGAAGVSFAYSFDKVISGATKDTVTTTQEGNSCGRCHASVGLNMPPLFLSFMGQNNTTMKKNIDCLACHIDREKYDVNVNKVVQNGTFQYGNSKHGNILPPTSNAAFDVAQVGKAYKIEMPTNDNCMTCHEHAMAGPVYKRHALYAKGTDVHAAEGMLCVDCHSTSKHMIAKGLQATDLVANDRPDVEVACVSSKCHGTAPHDATKHGGATPSADHIAAIAELNSHTAKLACISCHVKNETDAYAKAAMDYVNVSQAERGYPTQFSVATDLNLFKGGAIFNDFRAYGDETQLAGVQRNGSVSSSGYLGSIPEAGFSEWMMVQPGNYAWRWFNGTGTGMANAIASFGFFDPYYYQDGFSGFRGTKDLPAPNGFGTSPYAATSSNASAVGMMQMYGFTPDNGYPLVAVQGMANYSGAGIANLFGGYWAGYATATPSIFTNDVNGNKFNSFDKELYASATSSVYAFKGGSGDKIYPFRKMQAWMPVPRTNFWFLTPHDMATIKDSGTNADARNYLAVKKAIESPMMYMFFSKMFQPAMILYAQEFGFEYSYTSRPITIVNGTTPTGFQQLVGGLGPMSANVMELNGLIYNANAQWLDTVGLGGTGIYVMQPDYTAPTTPKMVELLAPTSEEAGQAMLINGQLATYMYFPMPLDANIMEDHAIAAKGFMTEGASGSNAYEPRSCNECHRAPNAAGTFDNPDWNPLNMGHGVGQDAADWGKNFVGTVNTGGDGATSVIDWKTLGYSEQEITTLTGGTNPMTGQPNTWVSLNGK